MHFSYCSVTFLHILSFGYSCLAPSLLLCWLSVKKYRTGTKDWMAVANGWFCVYAIGLIWHLFIDWFDPNQYEGYQYVFDGRPVADSSLQKLLLLIRVQYGLQFICFVLLLFRKARRSILITLLTLFSLHSISILVWLFITLETSPRGYVSFNTPKSWWESDFVYLSAYILLIATTHFILQRRFKPVSSG